MPANLQSATPSDATLEKLLDAFEKVVIERSTLRNAFHNGEAWVDLWDSEGGRPAAYPVESTLIIVDEEARLARTALREYVNELRAEIARLGSLEFKTRPIEAIPGDSVAAQRFWELVDRRGPDECWPWLGTRHLNGYGHISIHKWRVNAHCRALGVLFGKCGACGFEQSKAADLVERLKAEQLTPEEAEQLRWEMEGGIHRYFTEDAWSKLLEKLRLRSLSDQKND